MDMNICVTMYVVHVCCVPSFLSISLIKVMDLLLCCMVRWLAPKKATMIAKMMPNMLSSWIISWTSVTVPWEISGLKPPSNQATATRWKWEARALSLSSRLCHRNPVGGKCLVVITIIYCSELTHFSRSSSSTSAVIPPVHSHRSLLAKLPDVLEICIIQEQQFKGQLSINLGNRNTAACIRGLEIDHWKSSIVEGQWMRAVSQVVRDNFFLQWDVYDDMEVKWNHFTITITIIS